MAQLIQRIDQISLKPGGGDIKVNASGRNGEMKSTIEEIHPKIAISADWVLKRIQEGKAVRLRNAVITDNLDLNKLNLPIRRIKRTKLQSQMGSTEYIKMVQSSIYIRDSIILGQLDFSNSAFKKIASFSRVTISQDAMFIGATFCEGSMFDGTTFCKEAGFNGTTFCKTAVFEMTMFKGDARFVGANFIQLCQFGCATFCNSAWFVGATFDSYVGFAKATFCGDAGFFEAKFNGDILTFRDANFTLANSQEEACRRAKNVQAKTGNREEEEYHFYKEMVAKRKQKGIYETSNVMHEMHGTLRSENLFVITRFLWYDLIEYIFLQKIFGYGIHPERVFKSWILIIIIFGIGYWIEGGMNGGLFGAIDYLESSFATAIAPGYIAAIINNKEHSMLYHLAAIFETIFGTFLWAGFIATFAKRYMK